MTAKRSSRNSIPSGLKRSGKGIKSARNAEKLKRAKRLISLEERILRLAGGWKMALAFVSTVTSIGHTGNLLNLLSGLKKESDDLYLEFLGEILREYGNPRNSATRKRLKKSSDK